MNKQVYRILEIHRKLIVEGGGKQIAYHRPPLPQLIYHILSQGTFGADDLVPTG